MGRPPGQSDFEYVSPKIDREAELARTGTSPWVARVIYLLGALLFLVLVVVIIAGHIPRGDGG